jgi:hypothetical protein
MADLSIGDAVGAGFGLIRRKPLTVIAWGLARMAFSGVVIALYAPFYLLLFGMLARRAVSGPASPTDMQAFTAQAMQYQALGYLVGLLGAMLAVVLYCAVFRAEIHPERGRFAYLRVGAPEMFLFLLAVGAYIALVVGLVVLMIPVGIVIGILAATRAVAAAVIVGVLVGLAVVVALIYLALRFSMVGPMMVDDGKFHLMESWTLTRGKAGGLFLIGLALVAIVLLAEIVIGAILIGGGIAALGAIAGGAQNLPAFFQQPPGVILSKVAVLLAVYVVVAIPLSGCAMAILGAPWANAYRQLVPGGVSDTFA